MTTSKNTLVSALSLVLPLAFLCAVGAGIMPGTARADTYQFYAGSFAQWGQAIQFTVNLSDISNGQSGTTITAHPGDTIESTVEALNEACANDLGPDNFYTTVTGSFLGAVQTMLNNTRLAGQTHINGTPNYNSYPMFGWDYYGVPNAPGSQRFTFNANVQLTAPVTILCNLSGPLSCSDIAAQHPGAVIGTMYIPSICYGADNMWCTPAKELPDVSYQSIAGNWNASADYTVNVVCPPGQVSNGSQCVTPPPPPPPSISYFTVNGGPSASVPQGTAVTFNWQSGGSANQCTLSGPGLYQTQLNGPVSFTPPSGTNTYTVTCTGQGQTTDTVTVTVYPAATASLSASPSTIISGGPLTLQWNSTNATSCTGTGFSTGGSTNNSTTIHPTDSNSTPITDTYSVTCTGLGPSGSDTKSVQIDPAPYIGTFIASSPVYQNQPTNLSWAAENIPASPQACHITAPGGFSQYGGATGATTDTPAQTTTYTLTCNGYLGSQTSKIATVLVNSCGAGKVYEASAGACVTPTISSFYNNSICELSWNTSGFSSCTLTNDAIGPSSAVPETPNQIGSANEGTPTSKVEYMLSCSYDGPAASLQVTKYTTCLPYNELEE